MVQLSATRCSFIAILWVSLVSFAAVTFCVASQQVFIVVSVYFVIDSVRKLLDSPSYVANRLYLIFTCGIRLFSNSMETNPILKHKLMSQFITL
jgi:hypothetical protein